MSLHFTSLHQYRENFLVTSASPVYIAGGPVTANDMACLAAWFEITGCSAGINGGNPATITMEYTPDDGTTWVTVPSTIGGSVTGNSVNTNIQVTANTGVFPPVIRFKFVAPANESFTVKKIRRIQLAPGMVAPLRSTGGSALPGAPSFVELSDGTNALTPFENYLAAQFIAAPQYRFPSSSTMLGWNPTGNNHKEILVDTSGNVQVTATNTAFSTRFTNDSVATIPVSDSGTPANNIGMPSVQLAGQGLGPVTMGSGADSALTPRMTLSTRHEAVATPVSVKLGDGATFVSTLDAYPAGSILSLAGAARAGNKLPVSAGILLWDKSDNSRKEVACYDSSIQAIAADSAGNVVGSFPNIANTQFSVNSPGRFVGSMSIIAGWDNNNNTHKEVRTNTLGVLQVEQTNVPTSIINSNALVPFAHDYIGVNVGGATADVYTYKTGGAGGSTVATLTINYTDATKAVISSIVRT